ncbi:alpha/beta hydrolase family protein [Phycicoccus endophyticus]|uniref:alpha/beta hydrolase family protein n=1 Tax=Phycicoccus endophyticus TaxID=1690220 RepID=UPI0019AED805|nr:alpha/beta fold hydrolase [Phycicoccus endophyticus]GGL23113.1 alpha/beta hydrolase [Phycicoccus endophyticus]
MTRAQPLRGHPRARRAAVAGAAVSGTAALASGGGSLAAAAYFARRVLTPEARRPDDVLVREVGEGEVTLETTAETVVPGRYGLWLDGGEGHARLGEVLELDPAAGAVRRELLGVDRGRLAPGPARWNSYFHGGPPQESLGLPTEHVTYDGELGPMPAWVVAPGGSPTDRWAVLVHGRGARREEVLRAVPPLLAQGWTCLVPSYRNDEGVPAGPDGRYALGLSEWRDVDAAMGYAAARGAGELLLAGWSMGGAIVLQVLDRSPRADAVSRVVLDAPVVDWGDVLAHHAREHHLPRPVGSLARVMMRQRWGHRLVGVHEGVDLALTDWVRRADELRHRVLLIHSADDEFVPFGPSLALAQARPDLVDFQQWRLARHCKEWNTDPQRWEELVGAYVAG